MAMGENIFADDWRDCLRAHYMHVVRENDWVTLPTLTMVMHGAGFSDSDLAEMKVRATIRAEDVAAEFVPDLDVLRSGDEQDGAEPFSIMMPEAARTVPEEAIDLVNDDTQEADDTVIEEDTAGEEVNENSLPDPNAPQQLSLF